MGACLAVVVVIPWGARRSIIPNTAVQEITSNIYASDDYALAHSVFKLKEHCVVFPSTRASCQLHEVVLAVKPHLQRAFLRKHYGGIQNAEIRKRADDN